MAAPKTIGILGGGQLGRMLCLAAQPLELKTHIFCPELDACALPKATATTTAAYEDKKALADFAQQVDVITFEFENIPEKTVAFLAELKPLYPPPSALALTQDRATEKTFLNSLGIATAPWCLPEDIDAESKALAFPSILKTRRFGYDGKGQVPVASRADLPAALDSLNAPSILESLVPFNRELAFVCARGVAGEMVFYPPTQTFHAGGILRQTLAPASLSPHLTEMGFAWCKKIAEHLDYVGVLAVETFQVGGKLLVNEIAPRVHNSYHWTIEGAATSQFAQHMRAVAGLPLGKIEPIHKTKMINLIGFDGPEQKPNATLHDYGKGQASAGRKMGHITQLLVD